MNCQHSVRRSLKAIGLPGERLWLRKLKQLLKFRLQVGRPIQHHLLVRHLVKKAAGLKSGSSTPNSVKVGSVTQDQVREIAEIKMKDLNAVDIENAMRIIEGTARSMGITVSG